MYKKIVLGLVCFGGSLFAVGHYDFWLGREECGTLMRIMRKCMPVPRSESGAIRKRQSGKLEDSKLKCEDTQTQSDDNS